MPEEKEQDKYALREQGFLCLGEEHIDTEVLERIPFDYPESATEVEYTTEEFTSVCPWSALPDFATLTITYVPIHHLVELKSLKYYLLSFRNVGILQEHVVNRVLGDLVALVEPATMTVEAWFNDRGGLQTYVEAEWPRSK